MLPSLTARLMRRRLRTMVGGGGGAWALRVPLITLALAASLALLIPRR